MGDGWNIIVVIIIKVENSLFQPSYIESEGSAYYYYIKNTWNQKNQCHTKSGVPHIIHQKRSGTPNSFIPHMLVNYETSLNHPYNLAIYWVGFLEVLRLWGFKASFAVHCMTFVNFNNKSHNMKALVILSYSWLPFSHILVYMENMMFFESLCSLLEYFRENLRPHSHSNIHMGSYRDSIVMSNFTKLFLSNIINYGESGV